MLVEQTGERSEDKKEGQTPPQRRHSPRRVTRGPVPVELPPQVASEDVLPCALKGGREDLLLDRQSTRRETPEI